MSVQEYVSSESDSENLAEQGGNEDEEMSLPPCQFCHEQAPDDPREGKNRATILWIYVFPVRLTYLYFKCHLLCLYPDSFSFLLDKTRDHFMFPRNVYTDNVLLRICTHARNHLQLVV